MTEDTIQRYHDSLLGGIASLWLVLFAKLMFLSFFISRSIEGLSSAMSSKH